VCERERKRERESSAGCSDRGEARAAGGAEWSRLGGVGTLALELGYLDLYLDLYLALGYLGTQAATRLPRPRPRPRPRASYQKCHVTTYHQLVCVRERLPSHQKCHVTTYHQLCQCRQTGRETSVAAYHELCQCVPPRGGHILGLF
jgi:hypothetical protein